jgi:hypothetical protein
MFFINRTSNANSLRDKDLHTFFIFRPSRKSRSGSLTHILPSLVLLRKPLSRLAKRQLHRTLGEINIEYFGINV